MTPDFMPLDFKTWDLCGMEENDRITTILNLVALEKTQGVRRSDSNIKKHTKTTIVDVSQNPCRKAWTGKNSNHTMCSSTIQVHMGLKRIITPREMMLEQGHSPSNMNIPEDMPPGSVRKLAGQGMALPCIGTCLWGMFLTKGFPKK